MNFRDQQVTCSVCEKPFIFTVTTQRRLHESGQAVRDQQTGDLVPPDQFPSCRLRYPDTGRWSGHSKWFSHEKGYGFIVKPDADEVFFHRSQVIDDELVSLEDGLPVTFEQVTTEKGDEAQKVRVETE
jgi:cold shock CspA family protein